MVSGKSQFSNTQICSKFILLHYSTSIPPYVYNLIQGNQPCIDLLPFGYLPVIFIAPDAVTFIKLGWVYLFIILFGGYT